MRAEGLIGLYNNPAVNRMVEFAAVANTLASDVGMLARCYEHLVRVAPRRHARGKRYVHGRTGTTSSGASSNRREEHLAVALCNASRRGVAFALPDRRPFAIIDYQMPLKARQGDLGVGKVDLFAVVDGRLPCVIELKVAGESARGDTRRCCMKDLLRVGRFGPPFSSPAGATLQGCSRRFIPRIRRSTAWRIGRPTIGPSFAAAM